MQESLLTYNEVLKELEKTKPNNHLLLGNGFNLSLGVKTDYNTIYEVMKKNNKDYEGLDTKNFDLEVFIGDCKENIKEENNPYAKFMKLFFHNKIKLDFMKAVTQIVAKEVKKIRQLENEEIYLLFKQFDTFFTLNYDPFLYQLLMSFKKPEKNFGLAFRNSLSGIRRFIENENDETFKKIEKAYKDGFLTINIDNIPQETKLNLLNKAEFTREINKYFKGKNSKKELKKMIDCIWEQKEDDKKKVIENIDDGYRYTLFGDELIYQNPETQNLFFLHGAFHLYKGRKCIQKITQQNEKALYNRIEEVVENPNKNLICVFSDKNKELEINKNEYLRNGLNKIEKLNGSLVILGSSLADNDSHIFNRINKSKITKIYISSFKKDLEKNSIKANKFFNDKEIIFFDTETISYIKE